MAKKFKTNAEWNAIAKSWGFADMEAVKTWLRNNGLKVDGKIGDDTKKELLKRGFKKSSGTVSSVDKDLKTNRLTTERNSSTSNKTKEVQTKSNLKPATVNVNSTKNLKSTESAPTLFDIMNNSSDENVLMKTSRERDIDNATTFLKSTGVYTDEEVKNKATEIVDTFTRINQNAGPTTPSLWRNTIHQNLYPYGYSDENASSTFVGDMFMKIIRAFGGKSKAREAYDEFLHLNLNTPEGLLRAKELRPFLKNFSYANNESIQNSMRLRTDATGLYDNYEQKYNSFKINPEYVSNQARDAGVPTLTFTDRNLRKQYLEQMAAYLAQHPEPTKITPEYFIYNVTGDPGMLFGANYSIVLDRNPQNPNLRNNLTSRYLDQWDYALNVPGAQTVIFGDTIPTNYHTRRGNSTMVRTTNAHDGDTY